MKRQTVNYLKLFFLAGLILINTACSDANNDTATEEKTRDLASPEKDWQVVDTFQVGNNVFVRSLAIEDATNTLWVGTSVGVLEIDLATQQVRNTFTRDSGLANEYVFAIGIDADGYKWFGTNGGAASRYKDGKWKTYFPLHGIADYWIYAFTSQSDGTLWIGTWAGANKYDLKTGKFTTYVKELINEWVYGLGVDSKDRVWFGTEGGVSMYDGKQWVSWTHKDGLGASNVEGLLPSSNTGLGTRSRHQLSVLRDGKETYNPNYVFSILVDPQDDIWAGTWGGGVSRYDGKKWTSYTHADGLGGNVVYSIVQDKQGVYWFGTNHGVTRYDGKNWRTFTKQQGLIDNSVYSMAISKEGDIWIATRGGVSRLGLRAVNPEPHAGMTNPPVSQ